MLMIRKYSVLPFINNIYIQHAVINQTAEKTDSEVDANHKKTPNTKSLRWKV